MKIPKPSDILPKIRERQEKEDEPLLRRCIDAIHGMTSVGVCLDIMAGNYSRESIQRVEDALEAEGWVVTRYTGDQREPANELRIKAPTS